MRKFFPLLMGLFWISAIMAAVPAKAAGPDISAQAAALYVPERDLFLMERAARQKLPIASTTKIMSALLLCEQVKMDATFTATAEMVTVEGSSMGLQVGDTVTAEALLYGMLLASGNDAANMTAHIVAGGLPAFAQLMNKRAAEIGMTDTNFVTPSGLDAEEHYSTARDLALLAACALKNPLFRQAAACRNKTLEYGNPPYRRTLSNHNKLLGMYDGAIGVKTGFTKKAGRCLVAASEKNGILLVSVTLNAPSDWEDHEKLLDYGYSRLKRFDLPGGLGGKSLPVVGAGEPDAEVSLRADSASVAADEAEFSRIERRYQIPAFLYAPVRRDVQIGCVEYYLDGKKVAATGIYADEDVPAASPGAPYYRRRFWFWLSKLLLP